jgi:hypothetical protein
MSIAFSKADILDALSSLARTDREGVVFESRAHGYRLNPPLAETTVEAFERAHGVALPSDYRLFITEIGNGGAGPCYGLFPFGIQDHNADFCKWEEGYLVGDFSKEFAHAEAWNGPQGFMDLQPKTTTERLTEDVDRIWEQWDQYVNEHYWTGSVFNGAIPICHRGCALRDWLVIHGLQRGYVWGDERADYKGIYPLRNADGVRLTFANWYMTWLSSSLRAVGLA